MYYKDYMQEYYLKNKEKIKKQSMEWREKNIDKVKAIQKIYRGKHGSASRDYRNEKIEVLPLNKRVSKECLTKMKENTRINQKLLRRCKLEDTPQEKWLIHFIIQKAIIG